MKEQLILFGFFVGIGSLFGWIMGVTSSIVVYNDKTEPYIGRLKLITVAVATCVIMPGNDVIVNSLFGLGATSINWGNWVIMICWVSTTVFTFKAASHGRKVRAR